MFGSLNTSMTFISSASDDEMVLGKRKEVIAQLNLYIIVLTNKNAFFYIIKVEKKKNKKHVRLRTTCEDIQKIM